MTWIFWTAVYLLAQFVVALFLGNFIRQGRQPRRVVAKTVRVRQQHAAAWH